MELRKPDPSKEYVQRKRPLEDRWVGKKLYQWMRNGTLFHGMKECSIVDVIMMDHTASLVFEFVNNDGETSRSGVELSRLNEPGSFFEKEIDAWNDFIESSKRDIERNERATKRLNELIAESQENVSRLLKNEIE